MQILDSPISGICDLKKPLDGVRVRSIAGNLLGGVQLLGADLAPTQDEVSLEPCDAYLRSGDLVANYQPTKSHPFRTQAYWRLNSHELASPSGDAVAALELVASKQTDLLDSRPDLLVCSHLPAAQVWRLISDDGNFQQLEGSGPQELFPTSGTSCCVYRLADSDLSYAEMVYPLDFERTLLDYNSDRKVIVVEHRLFGHRLEKGVILRSRVLGLFLPRAADLQIAAEHYAMFAASDPPLTA